MALNSVYITLKEIFPQVDVRLLKAVAIEKSEDLDGAVESILTEVLPFVSDKFDVVAPDVKSNGDLTETPSPSSSIAGPFSGKDVNEPLLNSIHNDSDSLASSFYDANDSEDLQNANTKCEATFAEVSQGEKSSITSESLISQCSKNDCILDCGDFEGEAFVLSHNYEDKITDVNSYKIDDPLLTVHSEHCEAHVSVSNHIIMNQDSVEDVLISDNHQEQQSLDNLLECQHFEAGVSMAVSEPVIENKIFFSDADFTDMSSYMDANFTQDFPVPDDDGVIEGQTSLSTIVTHSGQICKINLLEDIIEEAKHYKDALFTATESVIRLIEDVEYKEKEAEQAKLDASRGGLDILEKVEEMKMMLKHAKEANEMHAGEVYGEKSILATEVRELQTRVLGLADEKERSLVLLDEMRKTLEARLNAAEEDRKGAEREMLEKQQIAKAALAEQELIMEKVVNESKLLQQEAQENAKLRDFLMEKGHVVDELQGEISVICQDVKSLKEKFDNRVALSKSLSIEQTSFRLASLTTSVKSTASDPAGLMELPEIPKRASPAPSIECRTPRSNIEEDVVGSGSGSGSTHKEFSEEDWELFEY